MAIAARACCVISLVLFRDLNLIPRTLARIRIAAFSLAGDSIVRNLRKKQIILGIKAVAFR